MTSIQRRVSTDYPTTEHLRARRGRPEALAKPRNLKELIKGLHYIFEDNHIDVEAVKKYMTSYTSNEADWIDKANFDQHRYTRNLIDEGNGKFNLILLCWGGNQKSCIHDHSDAHCFMKVLDGSLVETKYSWPEETAPMKPVECNCAKQNEVIYINDSLGLHRVENQASRPAVSLHLYSPPFQMCQTFDEKSGHKVKCNVTFYSKMGKKVSYKKSPPKDDNEADVCYD